MEWDKVMEPGPKHTPRLALEHRTELTKATNFAFFSGLLRATVPLKVPSTL